MAETKIILCLANSRKNSGRCIAGKEVVSGSYLRWIRPVSARQSSEISEEERRYENGVLAKVLDIISIPIIGARPQLYQSENYVIDKDYYWVKNGEASWSDIKQFVDEPAPLWTNSDSTYNGLNDRVKLDVASQWNHSLMLIEPEYLTIKVVTEGEKFGNPRRKVRADFGHLGTRYILLVTDPITEWALLAKPDAQYKMKDVYLCVSLSEAHTDGSCYKLVATVLSKESL